MRIGDVLRYGSPKDPRPELVDGVANFWHVTTTPGRPRAQLERGINVVAPTRSPDASRIPAILLSSSPHKVGSHATPWQDHFDPDTGFARYYGDGKVSQRNAPEASPGNRTMLAARNRHSATERALRLAAEPLILFRRVARDGRQKGFVEFQGFGLIDRMELVTQLDAQTRRPFANYVFDLLILDLSREGEEFSWDWISHRRDPEVSDEECLTRAPQSWQKWVDEGDSARTRVRRSVARLTVTARSEQLPEPGTREAKILRQIMEFYDGRKHRFEALAEVIAARVLGNVQGNYRVGWITPRGHDFGIDFVGRLDIGDGFARTSLVVLGQAKCEQGVTSGRDIARTVARLQRGWFGCYVTTSFFSPSVQQEVLEDKYPIALVHGRRVAEETWKLAFDSTGANVRSFLEQVDAQYEDRLAQRRPDEVLLTQ